MIGALPTSLTAGGQDFKIRTDYRVALTIFEAYADPNLSESEKTLNCLSCLFYEIPPDVGEAMKSAAWFLDGGSSVKLKRLPVKTIDWEQDESLIFPEINKAAGCEVRLLPYCHWWTFLGYFGTFGDGLYAQILNIRQKRAKGKRLEKWEREFFESHKEMIVIREKLSSEEQAELDREQAWLETLVGKF